MLISTDYYPALLALTPSPPRREQRVDGVIFAEVLLGKRDSLERDALFWHDPHNRPEAAIREGDD